MGRFLHAMDLPPVWLLGALSVVSVAAQFWSPFGEALRVPGWAIVAAGFAFAGWAILGFARARTTVMPRGEPSALVESGPYRWTRNPIYLADLAILVGWSLVEGQPLGLVLVPLLARLFERRFILPEERVLSERLGAEYDAYRARVPRWGPWQRRR